MRRAKSERGRSGAIPALPPLRPTGLSAFRFPLFALRFALFASPRPRPTGLRAFGFSLSAFRFPLFALRFSLFALLLLAGPAQARLAEIPFRIISADFVNYDPDADRVTARGNVVIEYREYRVSADVLDADLEARIATFRGRVTINTGDRTVQGNFLSLDLSTRVFELEGARVLIPPEELEMGAREPVYAIGARIRGEPGRLTVEQGGVTTCDLEPPHYLFDAQRVTIIPGRRLEARKVSFYAFGHKLITLPGISIPLRTINQQSSRLVPVVGQSADEGYYLKAAYFYVLGALLGNLRLDLMSKKGIGVGFDQPYNFESNNGTVHAYYLSDQERQRKDFNARASHNQRVGEFNFQFNGDVRQNSLDYVAANSQSLLTDFSMDRRSPDGTDTHFGLNRSANSYAGSETGNWIANLRHMQTIGQIRTNLNMDLSQPFGLSTASTGRLSSRLNLAYSSRLFTSELVADRIDTLGGTANYFAGTQRLPELRVASQANLTFGRRPRARPARTAPTPGTAGEPPAPAGETPPPPGVAPTGETPGPTGDAPGPAGGEVPAPTGETPDDTTDPAGEAPGAPETEPTEDPGLVTNTFLRRLPLALEMRVGNLAEGSFGTGTGTTRSMVNRVRSQLRVATTPELYEPRPERTWDLSLPFEFNQMVYKSDEAQWVASASPSLTYRLGPASQLSLNHSILKQNGFTPFQSDFAPEYNTASLALTLGSRIRGGYGGAYPGSGSVGLGSTGPLTGYGGYPGSTPGLGSLDPQQAGKANVSFRTGYDFENDVAQDLVVDARYQVTANHLLTASTGYDWLGKQRFGNRSRLRDIQLRLRTDYGEALQLSATALYDTTNDKVSSIRASINTRVLPKWHVQAVYGKFPTGFSQQYMVTRDLHCWEASATFTQESGRRTEGATLWLTIKAFPFNRLFGISQSGGYLTTDVGQIY